MSWWDKKDFHIIIIYLKLSSSVKISLFQIINTILPMQIIIIPITFYSLIVEFVIIWKRFIYYIFLFIFNIYLSPFGYDRYILSHVSPFLSIIDSWFDDSFFHFPILCFLTPLSPSWNLAFNYLLLWFRSLFY